MEEKNKNIEFYPYNSINENINYKSKYIFFYYKDTDKNKIFSKCKTIIGKYKDFGIVYTNRGILINLDKVDINNIDINNYDDIINNGIIAIKNELIEYIY